MWMIKMKIVLIILIVIILLICGLYVFMAKTNKRRDHSKFTGKSFAHRGLHGDGIPENSLAAFKRAREAGYGVELDVQYTKDGKIVVFHDKSLKRMCGVDKDLQEFTFEELQEFSLKDSDEKIPLFEDVLRTIVNIPLVCEIKNHNGNRNDRLCSETYEYLSTYQGDYCIESFSPFLVQWFKNNHPEVIRGQLSCNMSAEASLSAPARFLMTNLLGNMFSRPDFIAYRHQDMSGAGFCLCKNLFHPLIIAWTARGDEEIRSAWTKADSVIFEKYAATGPDPDKL